MPELSESDNDSYHTESEDDDDEVDNPRNLKDYEMDVEELAKKNNIKLPAIIKNSMRYHRKEKDKFIEKVKEQKKAIDKLTEMTKPEVENLSKNFLFASLQSSSGIMSKQLDAAMANNTELEKYVYLLEKDNIRLIALLKGYGYEETVAQRDLLLADYTPAAQMKMQRQMEIMMLMQGLPQEQVNAAEDYIEGKLNRSGLENKLKRFIISKNSNIDYNNSDISVLTSSNDVPDKDSCPSNDHVPPSKCAGSTELPGPSKGGHVITSSAPTHKCIMTHPHTGPCTMTLAGSPPPSSPIVVDFIRLVTTPSPSLATKL